MPRRIFCEERIVIAFVIPGKPLSKKKMQYQHEYHEYNIGGCEYSQILPSQIPVFLDKGFPGRLADFLCLAGKRTIKPDRK